MHKNLTLVICYLLSLHSFSQFGTPRVVIEENGRYRAEYKPLPDKMRELLTLRYATGETRTDTLVFPGLIDGTSVYRDKKGRLIEEERRVKGVQQGYYRRWDTTGVLIQEVVYDSNQPVRSANFNLKGNITYSYHKYDPCSYEQRTYHKDGETISCRYFCRCIIIDRDTAFPMCTEEYDTEGRLQSVKASINKPEYEPIYLAYGTDNWLAGPDKAITRGVGVFIDRERSRKTIHLFSPYEHTNFGETVSTSSSEKEIDRGIRKRTKEHRNNSREMPGFDRATFKVAVIYNETVADQMNFSSANVISLFDSSMTGPYRIDYEGTEMHFEGYLLNGWLHGKAQLYLNDTAKLFEKEFQHGLQHGRSREWHLNGNLALDQQFVLGEFHNETSYYLTGGKKEYLEAIDSLYLRITDNWDPDGRLRRFSAIDGSARITAGLDKQGNVVEYGLLDQFRHVDLLRRACNTDDPDFSKECDKADYVDFIFDGLYRYSVRKFGILIEGSIYYDRELDKIIWEDNLPRESIPAKSN